MTPWYLSRGWGARPAFGFPWLDHMTAAQAHANRYPGSQALDRRVGLTADAGRNGLQVRAASPDAPCFRCGSCGWCGHGGRVAS